MTLRFTDWGAFFIMAQITCKIENKFGIHARPASAIVKTASKYESEIHIEKDSQKVSAKSIMGLMMLAASYGTTLTIHAEGPDESEALSELEQLFFSKFGEE